MISASPDDAFVCFLDRESASRFDVAAANATAVTVEVDETPSRAAAAQGNRSLRDLLAFTRAVARARLDAFLSPSVYTYFPLPLRLPAVVAIHDAIPERFPELTLPTRRARLFWKLKVWLALRQADRILTLSSYSARELSDAHGLAQDRIVITEAAPSPVFKPGMGFEEIAAAADRHGLPRQARWFMYVGGFNPHKNVASLIRAHAELARELGGDAPHLLLVGTLDADVYHTNRQEILATITGAGTAGLVHWTGFVPDEELRSLYAGALALILPSESEGYGLPAVEAAACGTPVIATTESPLPEVLEGGGIFVRPGDHDALVASMRTMAGNEPERRRLAATALERASRLSWAKGALAALAALREAAT